MMRAYLVCLVVACVYFFLPKNTIAGDVDSEYIPTWDVGDTWIINEYAYPQYGPEDKLSKEKDIITQVVEPCKVIFSVSQKSPPNSGNLIELQFGPDYAEMKKNGIFSSTDDRYKLILSNSPRHAKSVVRYDAKKGEVISNTKYETGAIFDYAGATAILLPAFPVGSKFSCTQSVNNNLSCFVDPRSLIDPEVILFIFYDSKLGITTKAPQLSVNLLRIKGVLFWKKGVKWYSLAQAYENGIVRYEQKLSMINGQIVNVLGLSGFGSIGHKCDFSRLIEIYGQALSGSDIQSALTAINFFICIGDIQKLHAGLDHAHCSVRVASSRALIDLGNIDSVSVMLKAVKQSINKDSEDNDELRANQLLRENLFIGISKLIKADVTEELRINKKSMENNQQLNDSVKNIERKIAIWERAQKELAQPQ